MPSILSAETPTQDENEHMLFAAFNFHCVRILIIDCAMKQAGKRADGITLAVAATFSNLAPGCLCER